MSEYFSWAKISPSVSKRREWKSGFRSMNVFGRNLTEIPKHNFGFLPLELIPLRPTSHLTIFMRGMRAKSKIQRNNYLGRLLRGKTSSVSLIAYLHARKTVE